MIKSRPNVAARLVLIVATIALAATSFAQQRPPIVNQVANEYGLESWGQIDAVRYTFNLDIPGLFSVARTWTWEPKTGQVTFEGKDKSGKPVKVSYSHAQ